MQKKLSSFMRRLQYGAYSIPVAMLAALAMVTITEFSYHAQQRALGELILEGKARLALVNAFQRLTEAESGKRGYLLIDDPLYLQPFNRAAQDVQHQLDEIEQLDKASNDADTKAMQHKLRELMYDKLAEMKEVMRLHDKGDKDLALEMVRTGIGREIMQKLRGEVQMTMAHRNTHVDQGLEEVRSIFLLGRIGVIAMTVLCTLMLVALVKTSRRAEQDRERQRVALREERDSLECQVNNRMADLRELTRHLQSAREDERERLARELHDELGALLTSAKLDVAFMKPKVTAQLPDVLPKLMHLIDMLNAGISLKRRIIEDLSPSSLRSLGLVPALEILCSETKQNGGVDIVHQLQPVQLGDDRSLTVYRLVQEALTNMAKYAGATRAMVRMRKEGEEVCVEVWDNGKGFDATRLPSGSHGLRGMRFRIEATGGRMVIASSQEEGTRLTAWLSEQDSAGGAVPTAT